MKKNSLANSKTLNSSQDTLVDKDNDKNFVRYINNRDTLIGDRFRPRMIDTSRETLFFKKNSRINKENRDTLYELEIENYIDYYMNDSKEKVNSPSELLLKDKYKLLSELEKKLHNLENLYDDNLEEIHKMDYAVQSVKENIKSLESDIKDLKIHSDDINKFSNLKRTNTMSRSNTNSKSKTSEGFFNRVSSIVRSATIRKSNTNNSRLNKANRILSDEGPVNDRHIDELKVKIMNTMYEKKMEMDTLKELLKEIQLSENKLLMVNDQYEQEMEYLRKALTKIQTDINNLPTSPRNIRYSE